MSRSPKTHPRVQRCVSVSRYASARPAILGNTPTYRDRCFSTPIPRQNMCRLQMRTSSVLQTKCSLPLSATKALQQPLPNPTQPYVHRVVQPRTVQYRGNCHEPILTYDHQRLHPSFYGKPEDLCINQSSPTHSNSPTCLLVDTRALRSVSIGSGWHSLGRWECRDGSELNQEHYSLSPTHSAVISHQLD
jgi:hypothetical protein